MRFYIVITILLFQTNLLQAQHDVPIKVRTLQLSLAPGLGTNGTQPGSFSNYFSINLTSGYSASTLLFEIGTFSNLNTNYTQGLQIAGITNITGANAFGGLSKKEKEKKISNGFSPKLAGGQVSGLTNIVLGDTYGAQITGGVNLAKGALVGAQFSGLANIVYKYSFGVQVSGLFNVSMSSISGVQVAALSNYTKGNMAGIQMGLLNQAGYIEGKNSYDNSLSTGIQLGLINVAKRTNGFQIGIINVARQSQGTQIGLINIYKGGRQSETRDGTAIGLLNIGNLDYIAVYTNDVFGLNYEISTGTRKNGRIKFDKRNIYVTNALIYSHLSFSGTNWGIGYGLKKLFFNRSPIPGMTEAKFFGYGLDVQHINTRQGEITKNLNLLTRIKFMAGKRIAPKLFGVNGYASVSLNALWSEKENSFVSESLSSSAKMKDIYLEYWPGFSLGILLH